MFCIGHSNLFTRQIIKCFLLELVKRKRGLISPFFSTHLLVATCHATAIVKLMTTSTGMRSATLSLWHKRVLSTPFPAPMITPVGPLRLSTQPGIGSRQAAVTATHSVLSSSKMQIYQQDAFAISIIKIKFFTKNTTTSHSFHIQAAKETKVSGSEPGSPYLHWLIQM